MHLSLLRWLGLVSAATVAAALPPSEQASVGDVPIYEFQTAPRNGLGTLRLDDLRGKPVLVEFWGTR